MRAILIFLESEREAVGGGLEGAWWRSTASSQDVQGSVRVPCPDPRACCSALVIECSPSAGPIPFGSLRQGQERTLFVTTSILSGQCGPRPIAGLGHRNIGLSERRASEESSCHPMSLSRNL